MNPLHTNGTPQPEPILAAPVAMLMGCHYTPMYSRRSRVQVLALIDQSSDAWAEWYRGLHDREAVRHIAEAGYRLVELHFLYGFGLRAEADDIALTRRFVQYAHELELAVIGYFQFFSVQQETFFLENPWARDCLQVDARGEVRRYQYDRPALCFRHARVRQYYRDGIARGLTHCDLDGIRLDNDYFRGCYCPACQAAFRDDLAERYSAEDRQRVFGLPTLEGVELFPYDETRLPFKFGRDPLWSATVRFRQEQRQAMMRELAREVRTVKPGAILGGNPAFARHVPETTRIHLYPPDLGETHDLACVENERFPARVGEDLRHQVLAYKWGQAGGFKVFASHHITDTATDVRRWPATREECALSMCEALCFGGHVASTTWGLRRDDDGGMLYRRPHFLAALEPVAAFLAAHGSLYRGARCDARVGVYVNREALIADEAVCAAARDAAIESLLRNQVPFRLVARDGADALDGVDVLIVPDARLVSDAQWECLRTVAARGGLVLSGQAGRFDEVFLPRDDEAWRALAGLAGTRVIESLSGEPEAAPRSAARVLEALAGLYTPDLQVRGSSWLGVDTFRGPDGQRCVHVLNYDNARPVDVTVCVRGMADTVEVLAPEGLGPAAEARVTRAEGWTTVHCAGLGTYMVIR